MNYLLYFSVKNEIKTINQFVQKPNQKEYTVFVVKKKKIRLYGITCNSIIKWIIMQAPNQ